MNIVFTMMEFLKRPGGTKAIEFLHPYVVASAQRLLDELIRDLRMMTIDETLGNVLDLVAATYGEPTTKDPRFAFLRQRQKLDDAVSGRTSEDSKGWTFIANGFLELPDATPTIAYQKLLCAAYAFLQSKRDYHHARIPDLLTEVARGSVKLPHDVASQALAEMFLIQRRLAIIKNERKEDVISLWGLEGESRVRHYASMLRDDQTGRLTYFAAQAVLITRDDFASTFPEENPDKSGIDQGMVDAIVSAHPTIRIPAPPA